MRLSISTILMMVTLTFTYYSCNEDVETKLFVLSADNGIDFENKLTYTEEFNPYTYRNFYNGGGVALGDINNDGWIDIYFTGNQVDNKLYLNENGKTFKDITLSSGTACPDVWSSGANMVDINGDGLLDIYVCKAGKPSGTRRYNELFINNGDLTFTESAKEYGLAVEGLSIQSAFFDYDKDGDLDCYLLNNSLKSVSGFTLQEGARDISSEAGNKFFKNEGGKFIEYSQEAGIYTSAIGFGLGITLSDFNNDSWTDMYISNDFFEKDYLYINNQDGTFTESGEKMIDAYAMGAMGADASDLDNDGYSDIMVTEMLPSTDETKKTNAIYDPWTKYKRSISKGYAHQFPRNVVQRNLDGQFYEVGRLSGMEATDWSWSALLADIDNDGWKDVFVSNGVYKDLLDRDYLTYFANDTRVAQLISESDRAISSLIDTMPVRPVTNFVFRNRGDFQFENYSDIWGLGESVFTNGCAFGDLDNDGDLDLVLNNVNDAAGIYYNSASQNGNSFLKLRLRGSQGNTMAIGAKAIVTFDETSMMLEHYPSRGFQSSHPNELIFGLGLRNDPVDVKVIWPDGKVSQYQNVDIDTTIVVDYDTSSNIDFKGTSTQSSTFIQEDFDFDHNVVPYNQFNKERMMYKMNTRQGPSIKTANLNNDDKKDIVIGGGKNQHSRIYFDTGHAFEFMELDNSERAITNDIAIADLDSDGDLDIYLANGGSSFSQYDTDLNDQIYLNNGKGEFSLVHAKFPFKSKISTNAVEILEDNKSNTTLVIIGYKNDHLPYASSGGLKILKPTGELEIDLIKDFSFEEVGMIKDVVTIDFDNDDDQDIVAVSEWGPVSFIENRDGDFSIKDQNNRGIWNTIYAGDIDQDGDDDLIIGNSGLNTSIESDFVLVVNDFDKNGSIEQVLCRKKNGSYFPVHDMDEFVSQVPGIKKNFKFYKEYSTMSMTELVGAKAVGDASIFNIEELRTKLFINDGGELIDVPLPIEVQYSSVHAIHNIDIDGDGYDEIFLGGNNYNIKPQFGREDASHGWYMNVEGQNDNFRVRDIKSLHVKGEIRSIESINNSIFIGINNEMIKVLKTHN